MLTEEIVIFCLWDENLPFRVQRGVADKVMAAELPEMKIGKPNLPKELGNNPNLQDLGLFQKITYRGVSQHSVFAVTCCWGSQKTLHWALG